MTGTHLENKVEEMVNLIDILRPSISQEIKGLTFMVNAPEFREKIIPVYYRRKREDVLTELPNKIEKEEWCELNPEERYIYERSLYGDDFSKIRRVSWNIDDLNKSSKAQRLKEIVEEAENEGRKIIVFSFFLNTIQKIYGYFEDRCVNPINGSVSIKKRQEILDEFEKAKPGTILLAQITSGGVGLNIQAASVVVICEPQFKPSTEEQAISRAYRMGQSRNVLVFRLLCENTFEERMLEMLRLKKDVFNAFADKSAAAKMDKEISNESFKNIISEEIESIKKKKNLFIDESKDVRVKEIRKKAPIIRKI